MLRIKCVPGEAILSNQTNFSSAEISVNFSQLLQELPYVLDHQPFNNLTTVPFNDTVDVPIQSICSNETIRDAVEVITSEQLLIGIICGDCST